MRRMLIAAIGLLGAGPLRAQTLSTLQVGAHIRVTTAQGATIEANFVRTTADSLWIKPEGAGHRVQSVSRPGVFNIERREGEHALGFIVGALVGAGGAVVTNSLEKNQSYAGAFIAVDAVVMGTIMAIWTPFHHWVRIPAN